MKIIIVGCGKVGRTLAEQLCRENHDVTVIDHRAEALKYVSDNLDALCVVGNGAVFQTQIEAGVKEADLLIATTGSDELNMLCCLIAKKTGDCHTVARIRNPEYYQEIQYIRGELNLSLAINPERAAAVEIARLLRFPSAIKIEPFAKGRVELLKFMIPKDSALDQMQVSDVVSKLKSNVLICAVERGEDIFIPDGSFIMQAGDKISFIASHKDSAAFFKKAGIVNNAVKTAILVGGGKLAYYLAKALSDTRIKIKIIERDETRCRELSKLLPGAMIIHGDGTDQNLLLEEGIQSTEAFASLTGVDEENIMMSLYAASQSNAKLITKVGRIAFENVINSLNLGSVIYPKLLTGGGPGVPCEERRSHAGGAPGASELKGKSAAGLHQPQRNHHHAERPGYAGGRRYGDCGHHTYGSERSERYLAIGWWGYESGYHCIYAGMDPEGGRAAHGGAHTDGPGLRREGRLLLPGRGGGLPCSRDDPFQEKTEK